MTLAWAIVLGFVLGLRHATDADHVAAIGTMLHREPTKARAKGRKENRRSSSKVIWRSARAGTS